MFHFLIKAFRRVFQKGKKDSRNHFYYHKIYFRRISLLYNTFETKKSAGLVVETSEPIMPFGLRFGIQYNSALKRMDKVSFKYDNKNKDHNHKAVLVKQEMQQLKLLIQLQFYNNRLFFVGVDVSRYAKDDRDKAGIINKVLTKYLSKPYVQSDELPVIEDREGACIIINDDVHLAICYFDGSLTVDAKTHLKRLMQGAINAEPVKQKEGLFYSF
jgi:hypothetical protein